MSEHKKKEKNRTIILSCYDKYTGMNVFDYLVSRIKSYYDKIRRQFNSGHVHQNEKEKAMPVKPGRKRKKLPKPKPKPRG